MSRVILDPPTIVYPESDGEPFADNTLQFEYIATIQGNLDSMFRDDPNIFVAGPLLWYPVEGHPETRIAPDVLVAFGRPKGHRGSYRQWEEGSAAPQVVFETLSSRNSPIELTDKFDFYQHYGVEEYYLFDPDRGELRGYLRQGERLCGIAVMQGHVSSRLGVRFELVNGKLRLYDTKGRRFRTYVELVEECDHLRQQNKQDKQLTEQLRRADRLAALLREHGIEPPA
jgi:Uma2 family endonuclease